MSLSLEADQFSWGVAVFILVFVGGDLGTGAVGVELWTLTISENVCDENLTAPSMSLTETFQ
ncbi:MAG: hypothetical protein DDT19_01874 [Syntrophomonadaceae bacterium]|nr:hypothetical protein [Bacillota bacterium]